MNNKLSHSSITKFMNCGEQYRLHYVERLRPTTISSALLFGSAIDKGVEHLVNTGNLEEAKEYFNNNWLYSEINGVRINIKESKDIVYSSTDYDKDLIPNNVDISLTESNLNWYSLHTKGLLMLEAVHNQVLLKIKKVHSTQEQIELKNNDGDTVIGFVDLVADYEGEETPVIFDWKTASRPYADDSVITSPQLSLYMHAISEKYKTRRAGFIVMSKLIQKNRKKVCSSCGTDGSGGRHKTCNAIIKDERCNGEWIETIDPKCHIEVIIDDIPEATEDLIINNADNVNNLIKQGIYTKNLKTCSNDFGKKCIYFDKCYKGKTEGLVKV